MRKNDFNTMPNQIRITALRRLGRNTGHRATSLSQEEGAEIIKAFRRGVSMTRISAALKLNTPTLLNFKLGTWALNYANLEPQATPTAAISLPPNKK